MRNYIELNGKSSLEIQGLIIQELPPISKPKIRTNIEEIDGRDGDIITKLGYSAYEKDFKIGLYGDFEIDDIISYFNSSGKVTFSNEPDKYYNYQILEQIDFERLVRFRTATVKMHVQPFKYSNIERKITFNNEEPGTYTNVLDIDVEDFESNGITFTNNGDGSFTLNGTPTSGFQIPLTKAKTNVEQGEYTLTFELLDGSIVKNSQNPYSSFSMLFYLDDNNYINPGFSILDTKTITLLVPISSIPYLWIPFDGGAYATFNNAKIRVRVLQGAVHYKSNNVNIRNNGNYFSKPTIFIRGTGIINLSINNIQLFAINLTNDTQIAIDGESMNAYNPTNNLLMNRLVIGDYDNLKLNIGKNTISWTGEVSEIDIQNYSRWI